MIIVLDVGNTTIHFGIFDGERLLDQWRISTQTPITADELGLRIRHFIEEDGYDPAGIEGAAVASVVPPLTGTVCAALSRYLGQAPFFVDPTADVGMPIRYHDPAEVGADRIANAVAGRELLGCPHIVVDFGTATTFDAVSAAGEYLGGAIAPGIELSVGALFSRAARLPRVDLVAPGRSIGRSTMESMQSGIIHGYAGLVDRLVLLIRRELGSDVPVVATGGLALTIVPHASEVSRVEPNLTLMGIRFLYERSRSAEDQRLTGPR